MKSSNPNDPTMPKRSNAGSRLLWLAGIGGVLITLIAVFLPRAKTVSRNGSAVTNATSVANKSLEGVARIPPVHRRLNPATESTTPKTAEEIVAGKLGQFARNRRALAHAMAERFKIEVPADVERFFAAVEAGRWDEIEAAWKPLGDRHKIKPPPHDLEVLFGPIVEALGAAESAHDWPAQRLLDYGEAVLGSLRPGMVYVGGTDPGRFIPTLLNETSDGERHVIVTQNGLAAGSYLDYLDFLYGDRLATLTQEDSNRAFADYFSDYQRRLAHDQQFPDEAKQVLPGENKSDSTVWSLASQDGSMEIGGQTAVMAVNERLLQILLEKNPDLSFALEESFPLKSTYAGATPLGPITELRAQDQQNSLTSERAAQSLEYWREIAEQFRINPDESEESVALKTYSKMAAAQGNLFADHNLTAEAEQAYRLAGQICPFSPEPVMGLSEVFMRSGRAAEANQMLDQFIRDYPNQRGTIEDFRKNVALTTGQPASGQRSP